MSRHLHVWSVLRSLLRASGIQALTLLKGPSFWMVVFGVVGLAASLEVCAPIGLGGINFSRTMALGEVLRLLFVLSSLLVVLQVDAWSWLYRGQGSTARAAIVASTSLYLHLIGGSCVFSWLSVRTCTPLAPHLDLVLRDSLWVASLAGLLALTEMQRGGRALGFLLLSWGFSSALATPDPILALRMTLPETDPRVPDGILSMMVPHLLAFGYTRLQRARR